MDTQREWLGVLDLSLAMGAVLFYLVYLTWELPYPSEQSPIAHGLGMLLWCVATVIAIVERDIDSAFMTGVYVFVCAVATLAVGGYGTWRLQSSSFLVTHSIPLLFLGAVAGGIVAGVYQLKSASDSSIFIARLVLAVAPFIPLAVLHIGLRFRHRLRFPRPIRATFGGYRVAFSIVCKLFSFSLPLAWCILAEAAHHTLRLLIRVSAPQQWLFVERGITGTWPTPDMTSWQQVRLHASQSVIVGFQCDAAAVQVAGWVLFWLRHFNGKNYDASILFLSGALQLGIAVVEAVISTTLLHKMKIPISGVYWLFSKNEHSLMMVVITCVAMLAILRPELIHVLEKLDK